MTTKGKSMHCKECGNKVNKTAAVCMGCGTNPRLGNNFCSDCGTKTNDKQIVCVQCGASLSLSGRFNALSTKYAGFWKRVAAYFVDYMVFTPVLLICFVLYVYFSPYTWDEIIYSYYYNPYIDWAYWVFMAVLPGIVGIAYFCGMESSSKQGTLGKMALGIQVVDMNDNRISFGRAFGRYFGKLLSGCLCYIGFIMVGFTQKKQGLHDILAATQVINRNQ